MLAKGLTGAVVGLDGALVEVEVDTAPGGMPNFLIVSLPNTAVQEARGILRPKVRTGRDCTSTRRRPRPSWLG